MIEASVIILNYHGEKFINKTIQSVLDLSFPHNKLEIVVVDNASSDRSREIIDTFREIKSIYLDKNIGFAGGNNVAIRKAKGKYVVLLNNDCIVEKNWLTELINTAEKNENIFAVNSKIMLGNTNKIQNAGIKIFPNGYARDRGAVPDKNVQQYEEDVGQYEKEEEVDAACAAAVLYRKSVLDKIGLLDEHFFMYYEDVELSERAKKHGYKIVYAPQAIVYHEHAASSKEWSPFFVYHSERGRLIHVLFHYPLMIFYKELVLFMIKSMLRFLIRLFVNPKSTLVNWQYIRILWFFALNLNSLLKVRKTYENSRSIR